jgi:ADP-heptose:LPS heptosyltransferase
VQAKILIIRFSAIGDIVLTSPVLRILQEGLMGGAELHMVVRKRYLPVIEHHPRISKIFSFENTVQEVMEPLSLESYDYIIDLQNNLRSNLIKKRLGVLAFTVEKKNLAKFVWIKLGFKWDIPHVVKRYIDTLKTLGLEDDGKGLEFEIPKDVKVDLPFGDYTAVVIGANHFGKRPDASNWLSILHRIPGNIVIVGGKEEEMMSTALTIDNRVFNAVNRLNLMESAWVVKHARMVVAGDTGLMHIAAAFSKNIISIWGCTRPGLGMSPWMPGKKSVMIEPEGRGERPCSKLGDSCKHGQLNRCIHEIDLNKLEQAAKDILFSVPVEKRL